METYFCHGDYANPQGNDIRWNNTTKRVEVSYGWASADNCMVTMPTHYSTLAAQAIGIIVHMMNPRSDEVKHYLHVTPSAHYFVFPYIHVSSARYPEVYELVKVRVR